MRDEVHFRERTSEEIIALIVAHAERLDAGDLDDGSGAASSHCTFVVRQQVPGGGLHAVLSGRYLDRFGRDDGGRHFVERVVHPDLVGDLSEHMDARQTRPRQGDRR